MVCFTSRHEAQSEVFILKVQHSPSHRSLKPKLESMKVLNLWLKVLCEFIWVDSHEPWTSSAAPLNFLVESRDYNCCRFWRDVRIFRFSRVCMNQSVTFFRALPSVLAASVGIFVTKGKHVLLLAFYLSVWLVWSFFHCTVHLDTNLMWPFVRLLNDYVLSYHHI